MPRAAAKKNPIQLRREEEKERRRQDIVDAAERVIRKRGWEATNFGEIAKVARLSRALVYFYFPDRDDLFHAVCERGMVTLAKQFEQVLATRKTGIEQLMAMAQEYHAFSLNEPLYFQLLSVYQTREADPAHQRPPEQLANDHGDLCLQHVAQAITNGLADGTVRESVGNPLTTAVTIWSFTHGLVQIAVQKACLIERQYGMRDRQVLEHGFSLLRTMLAPETAPTTR